MCRSNSTSANTVAKSSALRAASNLTLSTILVSSEPEYQAGQFNFDFGLLCLTLEKHNTYLGIPVVLSWDACGTQG